VPAISRLFIRTAAVHLVAAMGCWVLVALPTGFPAETSRYGLSMATVHLLAVGWITQLIFGVALWMFPRRGRRPPRELPDRTLDRVAWALLNAGLVLRLAVEPGWTVLPGTDVWRWGLLASAAAQWAAVLYFVGRLWSRTASR